MNTLNLQEFKVIGTQENDNDILFTVEVKNPPYCCPKCRSTSIHGKTERFVRDLNALVSISLGIDMLYNF